MSRIMPSTTMVLTNQEPARSWQLIKRDFDPSSSTFGQDLMTIDILGPGSSRQGVSMLQNFSGFYHVPRTPVRQSWAYQEGSTPGDFPRVEERLLDFRLVTTGRTASEWEQVDSMLWNVLRFDQDCVLRVSSHTNSPREIRIRLDRKPKDSMTFDPGTTRHMVWDITAVACDPYWYGPEITDTWTNESGTGTGTLTLQNPSDTECWVQFASGPLEVAQTWKLPDGVSGYTVELPQLSPGKEFFVDTYPLSETLMVLDDSQMWAAMNARAFLYSIPPETPPTEVPVQVVGGTTSSTVTAYMLQRFDRPWSVSAPWKIGYDAPTMLGGGPR